MKYIYSLLLPLGVFLLTGCAPLPIVNSSPDTIKENSIYKYYDSKSQIRYLVSNDDKNLHISFKTVHPPTIAKILRAGLTVFFDKTGKKQKDVYVTYPIGSPERFTSMQLNPNNQTENNVKSLINATSIAAEYGYFGDKKSFITNQSDTKIQLSLSSQSPKELVYDLLIPFDKIDNKGKSDLFNLSIGIVTKSFNMPSSPQKDIQVGGSGQSTGGRRPQQPGSISKDANYSGGRQMGRAPHEGFSELSEDSKIWFQVGLYR
jgi:hypothetical protein